jgi:hypothetical protein
MMELFPLPIFVAWYWINQGDNFTPSLGGKGGIAFVQTHILVKNLMKLEVELYFCSLICLHGMVLKECSTGRT